VIAELLESATLQDVDPADVWRVQYQALIRLQLYFTGETHRMLKDLAGEARRIITDGFGDNTELDGLGLALVINGLDKAWGVTFKAWKVRFEELQSTAAEIAFGGLVVFHERYVRPLIQSTRDLTESVNGGDVFAPQLQVVIDAANRRVYADGIPLSTRLWNLDQNSRAGLQRVIYQGVVNQQSAWNMAKDLEQYLGFGADCPRWTSTRLRLTKKQIAAGDLRGLKRGEECRGQGVAYNALRLARNELQVMHGLATDQIMAGLPFITEEQIFLSPSHPEDDTCDQVIRDGKDGQGIYPKGTVSLPLHVQCLCGKVAVLASPDAFTDQLLGWLDGSQPWPEMDQYQAMVGGDVLINLAGSAALSALLMWAFNPRPQ